MDEVNTDQERIKEDAAKLLESVGLSRIVVVDDEYAGSLADLLGICPDLGNENVKRLQFLEAVNFENPDELWKHDVEEIWKSLNDTERQSLLLQARTLEASVETQELEEEVGNPRNENDTRAATCLVEVLGKLPDFEFTTLSHAAWKEQSDSLLNDEKASATILLFDRDLSREGGSPDEGLKLLKEVQAVFTGYCGLITHTVSIGEEPEAWESLASKHHLAPEKFVVISKERLNNNPPDYYGFLGMLRLAAISDRQYIVRSKAWSIFKNSVERAREEVEKLSPLDFDKIVFESSRTEGVSESDTLFRLFCIHMHRIAREQLQVENEFRKAVEKTRRVSAMPEKIANALKNSRESKAAVETQRFEMYEQGDELNNTHAPLELGDIFTNISNNKQCILLTQPCDLMVRENGKRSHDDKMGRTGTLIELVMDLGKIRGSREELRFFHEGTGQSAYANFAKAHQVQLSVLDLCVFTADGVAEIDVVDGLCPDLVIEPWQARFNLVKKRFKTALENYQLLNQKEVGKPLTSLALPTLSTSITIKPEVSANKVKYGIKRVLRLRRPWSSALLTAYSHYMARAAFDHQFERLEVT